MARPSLDLADDRLRRSAGAGALFYVAAFVLTAVLVGQPTVHAGQEGIEHSLVESGLARAFTGMYLLTLGFLLLLPAMIFLSRALGRRTPLGSWAAQTAAVAGTAYVVVIVGVGFSAGAAALWALHQELDLPSVVSLNNVRNFAYFVATPFMGLYSIAIGVAAISDRVTVIRRGKTIGTLETRGATPQADVEEWKKRFPNGFLPLEMNVTTQGQTMTMSRRQCLRRQCFRLGLDVSGTAVGNDFGSVLIA